VKGAHDIERVAPLHNRRQVNIDRVGARTGIFFGTGLPSLYVGVPAAGLEPAQIWNYGVPE
jgi:hypothetical protein